MKNMQSYHIGLDIGTNSVGWAVTSTDGSLLKRDKKNLWGVRLFESAETAAERRSFRSTRRRLERRKQRVALLQEMMSEDVLKADPNFYMLLQESFLNPEDKKHSNLYHTLPDSPFLKKKTSGEKYPSIYHLRAALVDSADQADIRYVYLALHHIMKYRGNFLFEGQELQKIGQDIHADIIELLSFLASQRGLDIQANEQAADSLSTILRDTTVVGKVKSAKIIEVLDPGKDSTKAASSLAKLLVGYKDNLVSAFAIGDAADSTILKVSLSDIEDEDALIDALGDCTEAFLLLKKIYNWAAFIAIRQGDQTISHAMVARFVKHKGDLKVLKRLVKMYYPDKYYVLFRDKKNPNGYSAYVRHEDEIDKKCRLEDFYAALKKILTPDDRCKVTTDYRYCLKEMEDNRFLPLLRVRDNGIIPNQFHIEEMELIIDNQGKYYPTLKKNRDRILQTCSFRLPYYVGPLNQSSPFAWIERTKEKIYPWNFDGIVDKPATATAFIERMTNQCTYIPTEPVLPLCSLLYEEYMLLDELNRVRLDNKLIAPQLKERLITGLFMKQKHVTAKRLLEWLHANGHPEVESVSGTHKEGEFDAGLGTHIDFVSHGFEITPETQPMLEQIIKWDTLFEDRHILREKLNTAYNLTGRQIDFICSKRYRGWGRLSAVFLDGVLGTYHNEEMTIIEVMRKSNRNLMKIITDENLGFAKAVSEINKTDKTGPIDIDEVRGLQGSPALKRGIWQSVKIIEELTKYMGQDPDMIHIEVAREDQEKGRRTVSRLDSVLHVYEKGGLDAGLLEELHEMNAAGQKIDDERLYLYFVQCGKCLYSGKALSIDLLSTYQVDHILPQSYVKDDSLENKALVLMSENQSKNDSLLLKPEVREHQKGWWLYLRSKDLMSEKKLNNLLRITVDEKEVQGFIQRQLVETRQIIQHLLDLFQGHYLQTTVSAIKAGLISDFRKKYALHKLRDLNDYHHAHDAYIACVIGSFVKNHMGWRENELDVKEYLRDYQKESLRSETNGILLGFFGRDQFDRETGEIIRHHAAQVSGIKCALQYKDCYVTYKPEEGTGEFYNQTIMPKGDSSLYPVRRHLPAEKYGGHTGINPAHMAVIAYSKSGKRIRALVNIPIHICASGSEQVLRKYLDEHYKNAEVIRSKILKNQLIEYEGSRLLLKSCSEAWNAKQLLLPGKYHDLLWRVITFTSDRLSAYDMETLDEMIDDFLIKLDSQYPIYSGVANRIREKVEVVKLLPIEDKVKFVREMLHITQVNALTAAFNKIIALALSGNQGRITNKPFNIEKLIFIDQSVTGIYERRTSL